MRPTAVLLRAVPLCASVLAGCASLESHPMQALTLAPNVDLPRYMGDWYVIANIPTFPEKGAHNSKEHYELAPDGSIATTFTFNADRFDGAAKHYTSKGAVVEGSHNAVWTQQYIWPLKADYRISYVASDYSAVVVTREKRDHVWIMARTPSIPEAELQKLINFAGTQGYDVSKIERVPQAGAR